MTREERQLREAVIAKCRWMNASGLNQGTSGNISARYKDRMLITPSATPYDSMKPEMIASMPLEGDYGAWEGPLQPSTEWRFHLDITRARPDVGAIVHPVQRDRILAILALDAAKVLSVAVAVFQHQLAVIVDARGHDAAPVLAVDGLGDAHGILPAAQFRDGFLDCLQFSRIGILPGWRWRDGGNRLIHHRLDDRRISVFAVLGSGDGCNSIRHHRRHIRQLRLRDGGDSRSDMLIDNRLDAVVQDRKSVV